jgi:predicted amidohydrolase YtcJ|tara:strand:- start:4076 stop:4234 length:159 start_codon:yes stop_codon:yes gene_type:complete
LNSKGLETLGVTSDTIDPKSGLAEYVRDENGELTGWVKEGAAWKYFAKQFEI